MRSASWLVLVLVGATALALGFAVMLRDPPAAAITSAPPPAATGNPLAAGAVPQGHVYAGITEEPDDVNPFTAHGAAARRFVLGLTHEGLLDVDPASATPVLRPALAAAFAPAADGMSCTFTLRAGVRFADGSPLTMADVLFGWELARAGHLPFGWAGQAFARVGSAEALDERQLRVVFKDRHWAAVRVVGEAWLVGQRRFFVERVAALAARQGRPAPAVDTAEFAALLGQIDRECGPGTGPYMLPSADGEPTTWQRRQDLMVVRNPHCWRRDAQPGTWNLDGVRLLFRDGASRFNCLVNGEIDWYGGGGLDGLLRDRPALAAGYRKIVYDYNTLGVIGVLWNCRKPPFDDHRVRQALGMLVDRAAIVERFEAAATPARAFAKPDAPEYPPERPLLPFDPKQARRLLREAGLGVEAEKPLRIELLAMQAPAPFSSSLDLFVDAAKQAGVEVVVRALEFSAYVAEKKRRAGDRDAPAWDALFVNRSFYAWGDPYDFVHSAGLDNDGGYASAEADRLATAARAEFDAGRRTALLRELHELVHREQPMAFFVHPQVAVLFNRHIENAVPGPLGLWPERFWVAREFQRR